MSDQAARAAYEAYAGEMWDLPGWDDLPDETRAAWKTAIATVKTGSERTAELVSEVNELRGRISAEARKLADDAIGLFIECRDVHGHDEFSARIAAAQEVAEGAAVTDAEISGSHGPDEPDEPDETTEPED